MRLLSCHLRRVRLHNDLELTFAPGLTVIGGPNEAGKSTLVEALHKALFLRSTATGQGVEELRSRRHSGHPEVDIRFEAGGRVWHLRKRFSGASGTCQLSHDGGLALSGSAAEERLATLLGMEQPVEGRGIRQLPERWAHLWVRQGEGGANPLAGSGERYDRHRLEQQLQQRGGSEALRSSLDAQVLERIQEQWALSFTTTGKVRAGSPLAEARRREHEMALRVHLAQERCSELEASMERLRMVNTRLERIESVERPALERRRALHHDLKLKTAELEPHEQRLQLLQQTLQQLQALQQQRERQLLEQRQRQGQREQVVADLEALRRQLGELRSGHDRLAAQQRALLERQETSQQRLELARIEASQRQMRHHREQFERLQSEAEGLKRSLADLSPIDQEQVRRLREAEQRLARHQARCEAMATSLELEASDQAVELDGIPWLPGPAQILLQPAQLTIGSGVRLTIRPGGGNALQEAQRQVQVEHRAIEQLCTLLRVNGSDAAEAIERQRRQLENELANLRQTASTIPWNGLVGRLAELEARRTRLQEALGPEWGGEGRHEDNDLASLEGRLEEGRLQILDTTAQRESAQRSLEAALQRDQALQAQLSGDQLRVDHLEGSLVALEGRRQELLREHGSLEQLSANLQAQAGEFRLRQQALESLRQELRSLATEGGEQVLPVEELRLRLEQEKDDLLSRRGQCDQLIASLSASDPATELEFRQAEWEAAREDLGAIERRSGALSLLQTLFLEAQSDLADRYGTPLAQALGPYLAALGQQSHAPQLGYDPQLGFQHLELRQGSEQFAFERLSGGMREQLAAAVRLALAEVLAPAYDGCLPLVFDDAFTNTDADRLISLKQMLALGVRQGVQVILLTCTPLDYIDLCKEPVLGTLISLSGSTT
jgi:DNA repair exonuclease SbcCD ATPase subunit